MATIENHKVREVWGYAAKKGEHINSPGRNIDHRPIFYLHSSECRVDWFSKVS